MVTPGSCSTIPRYVQPISVNSFLAASRRLPWKSADSAIPIPFPFPFPIHIHSAPIMTARLFSLLLALSALPALGEEMNIADLPAGKPADTTPRLAYGQMIQHGKKRMFAPCRDRSFYEFEDVSVNGELGKALDRVGLSAGRKLYVELLAYVDAGRLKASALNLAQAEGRCQVPGGREEAWRASGNEPGWILAAGGEWVQVKRFGQPELAVPYTPFNEEGGVARFESVGEGQRLSLRFEPTLCSDTMADAVFGWTASLTLNGETLRGCAWRR